MPAHPGGEVDHSQIGRFSEPAKFLPVVFVVSNIFIIYSIYMWYHAVPLASGRGLMEIMVINMLTAMVWICYLRCVFTHPGAVPNIQSTDGLELQERKASGDPRHCKWCAHYKPDRSHHCRVCRQCILRMDHHCPWIYNCVGFKNHKYFLLLQLYSMLACWFVAGTMMGSAKESLDGTAPFVRMFLLLFGETLAFSIGILITIFFSFHVWLSLRATTTIEFFEKSLKKNRFGPSRYDRGPWGNAVAVLGDQPLLWLLPLSPPSGDGLRFTGEETRLTRDVEAACKLRGNGSGNYSESSNERSWSSGRGSRLQ